MQNTDYKYEVAFSLCKQDVEFARKIIAQLNPGISVFFYESNQEELISQSGPEVFGRIFRDEARIVVILSRKEWSESYYTDIERNAIIDRTSVKNQGYNFLMVIPMMPGETPTWYPTTKIYVDPQRFVVEKIAEFIEFKLADEGGRIKQLTLVERYNHLLKRIEEKKRVIRLQLTQEALTAVQNETENLYKIINEKIDFLKTSNLWKTTHQIWPKPHLGAFFMLEDILLTFGVTTPDERYQKIVSSQDYVFTITLFKTRGIINDYFLESENKKVIKSSQYRFLYSQAIQGWAVPFIYGKLNTQKETEVLFSYRDPTLMQNSMRYYDLKDPINSETLIDNWFQELLMLTSINIEQYI